MIRTRRDYDYYEPPMIGVGQAHAVAEAESPALPSSTPVLWIPDPDKASGWREFYVQGKPGEQPARPLGFRKPGAP